MLYLFYVRKFKKHKGISPVCTLIREFNKKFITNEIVLCLPGYMSTTSAKIKDFCSNINLNNLSHVTFLEGMNGKRVIKNKNNTIKDEHNSYFKGVMNCCSVDKDHSKMVFYIDSICEDECLKESIALLKDLNNGYIGFNVKAVLLGSSNQSYNTYFGPTHDKGESDLLMISDKNYSKGDFESKILQFYEELPKEIKPLIVLSKQIRGNDNLLNEIFEKTIN